MNLVKGCCIENQQKQCYFHEKKEKSIVLVFSLQKIKYLYFTWQKQIKNIAAIVCKAQRGLHVK